MKTADHLEHLLEDQNPYTARAIPWYLVLTSGMADGYIRLADQYAAGARSHKSAAAAFRKKTSAYRTMASQLALRFAQNSDKLQQVPLGTMPLGFAAPKGAPAEPALLSQIAAGVELTPGDAETAEVLTLQHSVLMAACRAAGAPNDLAKAEDVFARVRAGVPRATFGNAIAYMLESESALYGRDKLDEPEKLAVLRDRAQLALKEAARTGSARIVQAATPRRRIRSLASAPSPNW
jgi:hypothetical protein